jgi:hypothetical protein
MPSERLRDDGSTSHSRRLAASQEGSASSLLTTSMGTLVMPASSLICKSDLPAAGSVSLWSLLTVIAGMVYCSEVSGVYLMGKNDQRCSCTPHLCYPEEVAVASILRLSEVCRSENSSRRLAVLLLTPRVVSPSLDTRMLRSDASWGSCKKKRRNPAGGRRGGDRLQHPRVAPRALGTFPIRDSCFRTYSGSQRVCTSRAR